MRSSCARLAWTLLLIPALMIGCGRAESKSAGASASPGSARGQASTEAAAPKGADGPRRTVLFIGTSLTAGLGLEPEQAFPALIQARIDSAGLPFTAVNAGLSGETAAGARRRVESWLIRQPFDVVVLETGSNDMLRGQPVDSTRAAIQAIVDTLRAVRPHAPIVLAGMMALPNLGRRYGEQFRAMYAGLARKDSLVLIPFLLDGVGGDPALNQPDGMHPNETGERIVAANVWRTLEPVLRAEAARPASAPSPEPASPPRPAAR
ncbi:MAG: arylesterase [Gemmatimonadetes bacterium]|nr:arylesterase [Gemmatimonadota bacterium]